MLPNEQADQLHGLRALHLFAGAGGGILADRMLGIRTVGAVEIDQYCQRVLAARQADGTLEWFPVFGDAREFDGRPWRGIADIVSGGWPCTDISVAGRGAGIDGPQSGLWSEYARIIREVRPRFALMENSPALTTRGLGRVLGDLAALGYDAEWGVLGADDVGANHRRDRMWIVAHADRDGRHGRTGGGVVCAGRSQSQDRGDAADPDCRRELQPQGRVGNIGRRPAHGGDEACDADIERLAQREGEPCNDGAQRAAVVGADGRFAQSGVRRAHDGLARELDAHRWGDWREWGVPPTVGKLPDRGARLKCLGNGQVPQCAAEAFRQLVRRAGVTGR